MHRLSEFSPRSLDVDVVLDLMIHDIDIVLSLTGRNARGNSRGRHLDSVVPKWISPTCVSSFPGGCVANLTASRVSTERVRKLRLFQPHEYISLDYTRQDAVRFRVNPPMAIDFAAASGHQRRAACGWSWKAFSTAFAIAQTPRVTGQQALAALEVAQRHS